MTVNDDAEKAAMVMDDQPGDLTDHERSLVVILGYITSPSTPAFLQAALLQMLAKLNNDVSTMACSQCFTDLLFNIVEFPKRNDGNHWLYCLSFVDVLNHT